MTFPGRIQQHGSTNTKRPEPSQLVSLCEIWWGKQHWMSLKVKQSL